MGMTSKLIANQKDKNDTPQVKVNTGGGYNKTMACFSDSGNDSPPLKDDIIVSISTLPSGGQAAAGCIDPKSGDNLKAMDGEKRIYARNAAGASICEIWLKKTGEIVIENANGSIEIQQDGTIKLHGIEISPSNIISSVQEMLAEIGTFTKSLSVNAIEVHAHTHTSTTPGSPTGIMIAGTPVP